MKYIFTLMTRASLKYRAVTLASIVVMMTLGAVAIGQMKQELLLPIEFPQMVVLAQVSGMNSDQVLTVLTEPMEKALYPDEETGGGVEDIINLDSQSTGSFGAVLIAYNDFGIDQEKLREEIQAAVDGVWLPLRRIEVSPEEASALLHELDAETLLYLTQEYPNFVFQLSPEVWNALSEVTVEQVAAYLAQETEISGSGETALEQLVQEQVLPQVRAIELVANVAVDGGQTLPDPNGEDNLGKIINNGEAKSLLLRLSPEAWEVIATRLDLGALDEEAVEALSEISITDYPSEGNPPQLPASWLEFAHFSTADDLAEMATMTRTMGDVLNEFLETGEIVGALGQTDDLDAETVQRMLQIDDTMIEHFKVDHMLAMSQEVLDVLVQTDGYIESLDGFTRDALAVRALAQAIAEENGEIVEHGREPVDLPDAWRIQPPRLISFSFADIPLATFSVSTNGSALLPVEQEEEPTPESTEEGTETIIGDAPALPETFAIISMLGIEVDSADDLVDIPIPPQYTDIFGAETLTTADFLNFLVVPEIPEGVETSIPTDMVARVAPSLIIELDTDTILYWIEQDPAFLASLRPEVFPLFNEEVLALEEIAAMQQPGQPVGGGESTDDSPELNPEWAMLAQALSQNPASGGMQVELDTADDLFMIAGAMQTNIGQILNIFLGNEDGAAFAPVLLGELPIEAVEYILAQDQYAFVGLNSDLRSLLSDEALEIIPLDLDRVWDLLASQPQFANAPLRILDDLVNMGEGAAPTLNLITKTIAANAEFAGYEVRLLDSFTPEMIAYIVELEPDFYSALEPGVYVKFSRDVLEQLPDGVLDNLREADADASDQVEAIIDGAPTAADTIRDQYASDIPAADETAPALNDGWKTVGSRYGIELDSADDFFRFTPDFKVDYPDAAALMNSLFNSSEGANYAVDLLYNTPADAIVYILERDLEEIENETQETGSLDNLSARALNLFSPEVLAVLPEFLQTRAIEGEEFVPEDALTRTDGEPSLFLTVYKDADANTVSAFHTVDDLLDKIDEANENIEIGIVFEQSSFVEESISGVAREGSLGAVFAIIIILLFLSSGVWNLSGRRRTGVVMLFVFPALAAILALVGLNVGGDIVLQVLLVGGFLSALGVLFWPGTLPDPAWRATIVIGISIPLSIMMAFVGMQWVSPTMFSLIQPLAEDSGFFDFVLRLFPEELTMNIMTLSGLTVAIGRVVDDSIVVLENIFRQLETEEITPENKRAVVISGTRDVSAAIFIATVVAVVVFLPLGLTGGIIGAFFLPFGLAVTYALAGSFIVAVTVVPVLAYLLIDASDIHEEGDIWVARYYLPILRWSLRNWKTKLTVLVLATLSFMFGMYLFGQRPAAFLPDMGEPQITVSVEMPSDMRIRDTNDLVVIMENYLGSDGIPQDKVRALEVMVGSGGVSFERLLMGSSIAENQASIILGLDASVSSGELDRLTQQVREVAESIFNCPGQEVDSCEEENVTVSSASMSNQGFGALEIIVSGSEEDLNRMDVKIINTLNAIEGIANVSSNRTENPTAEPEGSENGPDDESVEEPVDPNRTIIRVNKKSALSYTGEIETDDSIGVIQAAIDAIEAMLIEEGEEGLTVSQGFQSEIQTEGFNSMPIAMGIATIMVVVILMFTFQSMVYWLALILSIPVAVVGAAVALTLTNRVLGISALIGLLMLLGLVITNAVVLIDRVRSNRSERGMNLYDALVEAGGRRLRPILMTSLATIIALIPLAVGLSEGAIIASELGTVVIGGVVSSTLLTLIVVPVMYSLLTPLHRLLSFSLVGKQSSALAEKPKGISESVNLAEEKPKRKQKDGEGDTETN